MKKFLLTFLFLFAYGIANCQDITYTPFFRDGSGQTQANNQRVRATAYYTDYENNLYKLPIIITITTYQYAAGNSRSEAKVTSYYKSFGYTSSWQSCEHMYGTQVKKCNSMYGNELEKSFMYKADIPGIGTIYFDL